MFNYRLRTRYGFRISSYWIILIAITRYHILQKDRKNSF